MKRLCARLLPWLALAVSAAFVLGLFGARHWLLDLLAHWRVQYAVLLAGCALGLWLLRRRRRALLALLAALAVTATLLPHAGGPLPAAQATAPVFRFATFNVRIGNPQAQAIGDWLERSAADVVALQEVESPQALQPLAAALPLLLPMGAPSTAAGPMSRSSAAGRSCGPTRSSFRPAAHARCS